MDNGAEYTFFVKTSHFWAEAGRSHLFIYYFFFFAIWAWKRSKHEV